MSDFAERPVGDLLVGRWKIVPGECLLIDTDTDDQPIKVSPRTMDVLTYLAALTGAITVFQQPEVTAADTLIDLEASPCGDSSEFDGPCAPSPTSIAVLRFVQTDPEADDNLLIEGLSELILAATRSSPPSVQRHWKGLRFEARARSGHQTAQNQPTAVAEKYTVLMVLA